MKKRCLFIATTSPFNQKVKSGGTGITQANYKVIGGIFETTLISSLENLSSFKKLIRLFWLFFGYLAGNSPFFEREVLETIARIQPQVVFVNSSQLGELVKAIKLKFPRMKIAVQFQNIETEYFLNVPNYPLLIKRLLVRAAEQNEKACIEHADHVITLSEGDSQTLARKHGRGADLVTPIAIPLGGDRDAAPIACEKPYVLFCGANFPPNEEAVRWFIVNVLDQIDLDFWVVGFKMENLSLQPHPRLKVIGTVTSVAPYYKSAVAVICPIFAVSGASTKAVEALTYGKVLVANKLGARGLVHPLPSCVKICGTADEFAATLRKLPHEPSYMQEAVDYYEKFLSENAKSASLSRLLT